MAKNCSAIKADSLEKDYIKKYDSIQNGYNIDGGGQRTHIVSEETIRKRRETRRKNKLNHVPYHLSEDLKRRQALSRKQSKLYWEGRRKAGLKLTGRHRSTETKEKISIKHKQTGHKPTIYAIQNSINSNSIVVHQFTKNEHKYIRAFKNAEEAVDSLFPNLSNKKLSQSRAQNIRNVC